MAIPIKESMDDEKRRGIISFFDDLFGANPQEGADSITDPSEELLKRLENTSPLSHGQNQDTTFFTDFGGAGYATYIQTIERNKCEKLKLYRQMERFPYIDDAIDEILSEAINEDDEGNEINIKFKKEKKFNQNQKINLTKAFDHLFNVVMNIKENYYTWLREYIVTGEFLLENIIKTDKSGNPADKKGIRKVKFYQSEAYTIEWDTEGKIKHFIIKDSYNNRQRIVTPNTPLTSYINSGKYDYFNPNNKVNRTGIPPNTPAMLQKTKIVLSILEKVKKVYRQLDVLEDSLVIYRLGRAPERLVFNVSTGGLPKNKAEQYMRRLINKYRKKKVYNSQTGQVDQGQNVRSILDDFWFAKDAEGRGTDVTSLASGQNLGEITDVVYFLNKLYRAFKIPYTRIPVGEGEKGNISFNNGQIGSVTRDEIKFEKFVRRLVNRFLNALKQTYITHLKMIGLWDQYKLSIHDFEIDSVPSMYFTAHKEAEKVEAQFSVFNQYAGFVGELFSKKFILTEILGWDMATYRKNERWMKQEAGEDLEDADMGGPEESLGKEEDKDYGGEMIATFGPDGKDPKDPDKKK